MTAELPSKSFKLIIKKRFAGEWGAEEGTSEVNIPCVRVADFDRTRNVVSDDVPTIRSISKRTAEAKQLRNQDILIEKSGGGDKTPVGTPILYLGSENAICSNFIEVVRLRSGHDPRFWTYVLISSYESGNTRRFINQTTGIQNIDSQRFYDQVFQVPALETQQRIADYLDRETAEIDAAVADLDRYVELLEKRRLLIVDEILCKSKFPAAPIFTVASLKSGDGITSEYIEKSGEFPVYGGNGLRGYTNNYNQESDRILIGRQGALCGNIHLAKGPFFATEHALVVSPRDSINLVWFEHALRDLNLGNLSQASAQPGISAGEVVRQRVHLPPLSVQNEIASRISLEINQIDSIIADATTLRDLLLKRRSVLIAEIVTGRKQV